MHSCSGQESWGLGAGAAAASAASATMALRRCTVLKNMVVCGSKRRAGLEASEAGIAGAVGWKTSDALPFILRRSVCGGL